MAIVIRRARPSEFAEIIELDRVCFGEELQEPVGLAAWWVALERDQVVGYAAARPSSRWADVVYLLRVGVARSHRGRGLQKRLLKVREAWGRRWGAVWAYTDTAFDNVASTNSLISAGYRAFIPRNPWKVPHATYWRKRLAPKA